MSREADFDEEERAAARILARLAESGGVEFVSSWGPSTLTRPAARVLARGEGNPELVEDFAEWLIAQIEVADMFVEDAELAAIIADEWRRAADPTPARVARNPELEADLLAHPDESERHLVYGDWLQAQGDLYGELIIRQIAAQGPDATPALIREAESFLSDRAAALLGRITEYLGVAIHLDWRMGFVHAARVAREPDDEGSYEGPILLRWLLEHRACLLLRSLEFESLLARRSDQLGEMIEVLAELPPARLQRLSIGPGEGDELTPLFAALPQLRELEVRSKHLRPVPLRFPELRSLVIELDRSSLALGLLLRSKLPRLESLTLLDPGMRDPEMLAQAEFPALRQLRLRAGLEIVDGLSRSPLLVGLEALDLSGSDLDDALVHEVILPNLARFRRLRTLDLSDNALGEDAVRALEAAFDPDVVVIGEQHPVDPNADDDEEYYDDVME
ncbi:hypothetical protein ACNOYE_04235 [Nannocystaceae bacterium ST9]